MNIVTLGQRPLPEHVGQAWGGGRGHRLQVLRRGARFEAGGVLLLQALQQAAGLVQRARALLQHGGAPERRLRAERLLRALVELGETGQGLVVQLQRRVAFGQGQGAGVDARILGVDRDEALKIGLGALEALQHQAALAPPVEPIGFHVIGARPSVRIFQGHQGALGALLVILQAGQGQAGS